MFDPIKRRWSSATSWWGRVLLGWLFLTLSFAGFAALVSDLGLGGEIEANRWDVWAWIAAAGLVASLGIEVWQATQKASDLRSEAASAKKTASRLREEKMQLKGEKDSLLGLMEKSQSKLRAQAYADVMDEVRLALSAYVSFSRLNRTTLRAMRVKVDTRSAPHDVPLEVKLRHMCTVITDGGREQGLKTGMRLHLTDPQLGEVYAVVRVTSVHENGSTCEYIGDYDGPFWSAVIEKVKSNTDGIVDLPENRLVPFVPPSLIDLDPEVAEHLLIVLDNVVPPSTQR